MSGWQLALDVSAPQRMMVTGLGMNSEWQADVQVAGTVTQPRITGLAELIRQLVTWYEVNIHRSVGRYVFVDITQSAIYWQLLALVVLGVFSYQGQLARADSVFWLT